MVQNVGVANRLPRTAASPPRPGQFANVVEELRANHPGAVARAESAVPAPELFPVRATSRERPRPASSRRRTRACLGVRSWPAAWAPDRVEAFRLTQANGHPDADWTAFHELGANPAVRNYIGEVLGWFGSAGVEPGVVVDPNDADANELSAAEVAALFGPTYPAAD